MTTLFFWKNHNPVEFLYFLDLKNHFQNNFKKLEHKQDQEPQSNPRPASPGNISKVPNKQETTAKPTTKSRTTKATTNHQKSAIASTRTIWQPKTCMPSPGDVRVVADREEDLGQLVSLAQLDVLLQVRSQVLKVSKFEFDFNLLVYVKLSVV